MTKTILLDGQSLTIEQVVEVAYGEANLPKVIIKADSQKQVQNAADAVQILLERGEVAYGITTGFGAFKDKVIPLEDVKTLQKNIVMSHAVGTGALYDTPTTRAIMLIRANTLARGHSGIRLSTLQFLLDMLNAGIHPAIPEKGSLGASGDLAPLAHMALVMIGMGEAEFDGRMMSGADALKSAGLQPVDLAAKEGLALTNGTSVMCALGTLLVHKSERLSGIVDVAGALSLEALNGTPLAFDERIHNLRPFPRQIETAKNMRNLLKGSEFTRDYDPANVQDAYTLRCIPQVHGAARDAVAYTRWVMEIELNSVTDNPLIFIDGEKIDVISGGNFHGEPLAISMDYLAIAITELGNISERRIMRLTDDCSNAQTLPAFLTKNGGLNSGFMLTQYTAAALATENKVLAHPSSVDNIPTSANVEDHVSMGLTAALNLRQIAENVTHILATELMAAAQGIDFRKDEVGAEANLGEGTAPIYARIREEVPFIEKDTILYEYISAVKKLINSGELDYLES
ncbi:MAG: histidine ammonia-lyase [Anaerolineae bacterium]|jgi:histidine ammonia-lyase|nr:histidine ammonia-lyase [Anaerolineae bacterium]MBT4309583.1 histidine ammonia-lyase [Anaerolineae bacterium]MBT4458814.1 histidine ammonia-lyase [Anaerolineae bacterium]MBT4842669.1 histidine ammonia-lyase [Anaerolineae bacterium]MBT6059949.1 histidine ammonia-lyase [Anaerolineae bacterium]